MGGALKAVEVGNGVWRRGGKEVVRLKKGAF
jgi:hypothetical protein